VLRVSAATRLGSLELDVALEVPAGACLALAGPSGAGKTSVLRAVAGLLRPERGFVACGEEVWLDTARGVFVAPELRRCGYVFQEYALFGHLSAWQNVAYPLRGLGRDERRRRAVGLLERFGVAELADARPRTLSGGERQRVAVARALANRPALVLADEPTGNLDEATAEIVFGEFLSLVRDEGSAALVATHNERLAARMDRVLRLHEGLLE
jgi:molybdate transport system ATP-binding protein